jgi:hypothetical protein
MSSRDVRMVCPWPKIPVEMWWHTMTQRRESEGKTGEWSWYPVLFTLPRNMVYPALLPLMRTPRLSVVDWTDTPADLNGLVRFAERQNLVLCTCAITFQKLSASRPTAVHVSYLLISVFSCTRDILFFWVAFIWAGFWPHLRDVQSSACTEFDVNLSVISRLHIG